MSTACQSGYICKAKSSSCAPVPHERQRMHFLAASHAPSCPGCHDHSFSRPVLIMCLATSSGYAQMPTCLLGCQSRCVLHALAERRSHHAMLASVIVLVYQAIVLQAQIPGWDCWAPCSRCLRAACTLLSSCGHQPSALTASTCPTA